MQPACIATKDDIIENNEIFTMKSARAGNSCSGIAKNVACTENMGNRNLTTWKVKCYQLNDLLNKWNIWNRIYHENKKLFIKIDIESYECSLFPDFYPWLSKIDKKYLPTFYVSYHPLIAKCTDEQYSGLVKVVSLYSTFICGPYEEHEERIDLDHTQFSDDKIKACVSSHDKYSVFILTNIS